MRRGRPKTGQALIAVNQSHGRVRVELRRPSDGGTPPIPAAEIAAPEKDPKTGRFLPGNRASRRRVIKRIAGEVLTLNPSACASWLAPSVREGLAHAMTLAERFPDPALSRLVGAAADAHAVFRGFLALGASGDPLALSEARAWLREYRATVRELVALAGLTGTNDEVLLLPGQDGDA